MLPDACRACTGSSSPPAMARSLPADCLTSPHLTAPTMHLMLPPHLLSLPNLPTMLSPPNLPATTAAHLHRDLHPHPRIPRLEVGQMSDPHLRILRQTVGQMSDPRLRTPRLEVGQMSDLRLRVAAVGSRCPPMVMTMSRLLMTPSIRHLRLPSLLMGATDRACRRCDEPLSAGCMRLPAILYVFSAQVTAYPE